MTPYIRINNYKKNFNKKGWTCAIVSYSHFVFNCFLVRLTMTQKVLIELTDMVSKTMSFDKINKFCQINK